MTPGILAPPFFVAAGILVVSGAAKLRRPRSAAQAMYAAGIRGGEAGARSLGTLEVVAGTLALWRPAPATAVALAMLYLGFAGFVTFLKLARPAASSCGCAGDRDVPPNVIHVALDVTAAAVAVAVAVHGIPGLAAYATSLGPGAAPVGVGLASVGIGVGHPSLWPGSAPSEPTDPTSSVEPS
jgi:hypothetical protein